MLLHDCCSCPLSLVWSLNHWVHSQQSTCYLVSELDIVCFYCFGIFLYQNFATFLYQSFTTIFLYHLDIYVIPANLRQRPCIVSSFFCESWSLHRFVFSNFRQRLICFAGMDQFIGKGSFLPTILMFLEYGLAVASSTYCLTFFFSEHTMAQVCLLLLV